jgi:hypothetical protein
VDFHGYFAHFFRRPQEADSVYDLVRNFAQWFFNLLRNFVLVGGLRYFAERSGSAILWYLHAFALFVILLYCLSYADQWYVNLFGFLDDKRHAHWLNRTFNIGIAIGLFWLLWWGADVIVAEIAHAQTQGQF